MKRSLLIHSAMLLTLLSSGCGVKLKTPHGTARDACSRLSDEKFDGLYGIFWLGRGQGATREGTLARFNEGCVNNVIAFDPETHCDCIRAIINAVYGN